jgi:membrane protease YdiL (CAAX protease family)
VAIEQPWRIGPLLRLCGGILVCVLLGNAVALTLRYPAEDIQEPLVFGLLLVGGSAALLGALWMIASPWPMKRLKVRAIVFVTLVYTGIGLTGMAQRLVGAPTPGSDALQLAITTLSFQGAVLILVRRLVQEHQLDWSQAFGIRNRWPRAVLIGFMCAVSVYPVAWALQRVSFKVMTFLDWHPEVQHAVNIFALADSISDRIVLGLAAIVFAPLAEELLFRGVLYSALKGFGFPRLAFWTSAVLFSLIHFNAATFLPLLAFACLLNVLYERTGNLLTCIVAHASFNAVNLVMLMVMETFLE